MRAYKVPLVIIILIIVYAMIMVPMNEGLFPPYFNIQIVELLLAMFCAFLFVALFR